MTDLKVLAGTLLVVGCSVPVKIETAKVDSATASSVKGGTAYHLAVQVDRDDWQRVVKNQIYTYLHVVDCRTGSVNYAVYPNLGEATAEDFKAMANQMTKLSDSEIVLEGVFNAPADFFVQRRCVTLDGGSYFLHKIRSNRVVVRVSKEVA